MQVAKIEHKKALARNYARIQAEIHFARKNTPERRLNTDCGFEGIY